LRDNATMGDQDHEPVELVRVETAEDVRAAVAAFVAGTRDHPSLRLVAQGTTYWVFDPETNQFGPSKFCGFQGLNADDYARAKRRESAGDRFDGTVAREAIERASGSQFASSAAHEELLLEWGGARFDPEVFDGVRRSKWRFVDLPVSQRPGQTFWALLANPDVYRIDEAVRDRPEDLWVTRGKPLRRGDRAIVWRAKGRRPGPRGVIAFAEVLDDPTERSDEGNPYWMEPAGARTVEARVRLRYHVPPRAPLWIDQHAKVLSKLSVANATGGSLFRVPAPLWSEVVAEAGGWRPSTLLPASDTPSTPPEAAGVNHQQRAARVWDALVVAAAAERRLTYTELGEATGIHAIALKWPLALIQEECDREDLPQLAAIAVSASTRRPGAGFRYASDDDLASLQAATFSTDWSSVRNPFAYATAGDTEESLAYRLLEAPSAAENVYRLVAVRGRAQSIFRAALLEAYEERCAFLRVRLPRSSGRGAHRLLVTQPRRGANGPDQRHSALRQPSSAFRYRRSESARRTRFSTKTSNASTARTALWMSRPDHRFMERRCDFRRTFDGGPIPRKFVHATPPDQTTKPRVPRRRVYCHALPVRTIERTDGSRTRPRPDAAVRSSRVSVSTRTRSLRTPVTTCAVDCSTGSRPSARKDFSLSLGLSPLHGDGP
jgi:hypothetical protein